VIVGGLHPRCHKALLTPCTREGVSVLERDDASSGDQPSLIRFFLSAQNERRYTIDDDPQFVTRKAVMKMTGLAYSTLWKLQVEGQFPQGRKVSHRTMWLRSDVVSWIRERPPAPLKKIPRTDGSSARGKVTDIREE
jgi:predicted DNA-binding transcriptional regulator AlpA